ncbi:MAG: sel1 repeat family protein [Clostridiales bacterium]|nr:sel1 repeat family protein [Clostridiales bacterium]
MKKIITPLISFAIIISIFLSSCSVFGNERKRKPDTTEDGDQIEDTIDTATEVTTDTTASESVETETTTTTTEATTTTSETTVNPYESLAGEYKLFAAKYNESFTGEEFAWATKYTFDVASYPDARASSIWLDASGACVMTTTVKEEKNEAALTLDAGDEGISCASSDGKITGLLKDGIFELNTPDGILYFAQEGKETSSVKTTQYTKSLISEGNSYYYGTAESGCDLKKAESFYKLLEKANDPYGSYALGRLWANNRYTDTDHYKKAIEYYKKAIDAKYPLGYYGMGCLYFSGSGYASGVRKDTKKAKEYFEKAYEAGRLEGAIGLGRLYVSGEVEGLEKPDPEKALEYYNEAAKSDSAYIRGMANCYIGEIYDFGYGGTKIDIEKALEYYELSDKDGYKAAPAAIGYIYLYGIDVDKDEAKGVEYLKRAAKAGSGDAYAYLSYCYRDGNSVIKKDNEEYLKNAKKSAEFGRTRGLELLGSYYYDDTGTDHDYDKAAKYFRMAYKENSAYACGKLSYMSYYGYGVKKDKKAVYTYAKEGWERGELYCDYMLGYCYTYGIGTKKSPKKALEHLSYYIKQNVDGKLVSDCNSMLKNLVKAGKLKQKDVDKALK